MKGGVHGALKAPPGVWVRFGKGLIGHGRG
jgi:hypothetical protein